MQFLACDELKDAFRSFYILPTVFNTDLDRGFSVISYELCRSLASEEDLAALRAIGIDLTFDFILNHLSVLSPQFQDILQNGDDSKYRHFFIDWNQFWEGRGEMTETGYIRPSPDQFNYGNLRKNGLPLLMIRLPDGRDVPYWNTFYQKVLYPHVTAPDMIRLTEGQYDRAARLAETINRQLDAGKAPADMDWCGFETEKAAARSNFVNEPETWEILSKLRKMAEENGLEVLPEIHASYSKGYYKKLSDLGCMTYDYFLPGLILDALDTGDAGMLYSWAEEIIRDNIKVVNMLGCHDGIPMRDVRGLLSEERVDAIIDRLVARGGHKKIVHGIKDEVYQLDITYYSALGCDDRKLELARAIQLFMPGKPQVWYMDLLAGASDEDVLVRNPGTDTREVNRRCYSPEEARARLALPVVQKQLSLLKMRNTHPTFAEDATVTAEHPTPGTLILTWCSGSAKATLTADLAALTYHIETT